MVVRVDPGSWKAGAEPKLALAKRCLLAALEAEKMADLLSEGAASSACERAGERRRRGLRRRCSSFFNA